MLSREDKNTDNVAQQAQSAQYLIHQKMTPRRGRELIRESSGEVKFLLRESSIYGCLTLDTLKDSDRYIFSKKDREWRSFMTEFGTYNPTVEQIDEAMAESVYLSDEINKPEIIDKFFDTIKTATGHDPRTSGAFRCTSEYEGFISDGYLGYLKPMQSAPESHHPQEEMPSNIDTLKEIIKKKEGELQSLQKAMAASEDKLDPITLEPLSSDRVVSVAGGTHFTQAGFDQFLANNTPDCNQQFIDPSTRNTFRLEDTRSSNIFIRLQGKIDRTTEDLEQKRELLRALEQTRAASNSKDIDVSGQSVNPKHAVAQASFSKGLLPKRESSQPMTIAQFREQRKKSNEDAAKRIEQLSSEVNAMGASKQKMAVAFAGSEAARIRNTKQKKAEHSSHALP